jgi:helicase associated protein
VNYAEHILDAERQRRLEDVPGWRWDPHADRWEEGFSRLLDYVERHGDARVPVSYTVNGYKLGWWVIRQREKHAKSTLDADPQRRLQNLRGWTWKASSST